MIDGTVPMRSAQVTQVANGTGGLPESLDVASHVIAIQFRHMVFRSPTGNLGLRRVMAIQGQGACAVMIGAREALGMAVKLRFGGLVILQAVDRPRADRSVVAGLPLQDVGTATVALCLQEKVGRRRPRGVVAGDDVLCEVTADTAVDVLGQSAIVVVGFEFRELRVQRVIQRVQVVENMVGAVPVHSSSIALNDRDDVGPCARLTACSYYFFLEVLERTVRKS